jgi:hypothetical protein
MTHKTIDDLLAEFGDPFTREDFDRERAALVRRFAEERDLRTVEEIETTIAEHILPCSDPLVEAWIDLHNLEPYL